VGQGHLKGHTAAGSSSSSGRKGVQLLSQLPGPVLEQVILQAAAPQVCWAGVTVPTFQQLSEELEARPRLEDHQPHWLQMGLM